MHLFMFVVLKVVYLIANMFPILIVQQVLSSCGTDAVLNKLFGSIGSQSNVWQRNESGLAANLCLTVWLLSRLIKEAGTKIYIKKNQPVKTWPFIKKYGII